MIMKKGYNLDSVLSITWARPGTPIRRKRLLIVTSRGKRVETSLMKPAFDGRSPLWRAKPVRLKKHKL
jgi:hypothetical protein